jgi:hypothetical protein
MVFSAKPPLLCPATFLKNTHRFCFYVTAARLLLQANEDRRRKRNGRRQRRSSSPGATRTGPRPQRLEMKDYTLSFRRTRIPDPREALLRGNGRFPGGAERAAGVGALNGSPGRKEFPRGLHGRPSRVWGSPKIGR